MNKELKNIIGIDIPNFPIETDKVGDLIYFDGSLMGVFKDKNNNAYIYDWAESKENINRWLVYGVDNQILADYIFGNISHFNLMNNPMNDLMYLLDKNIKGEIVDCRIISPKNLPYEYLPNNNIFFDDEDAKNLESIIEIFSLNDLKQSKTISSKKFDILEEAKKNESQLINLHIKSQNSNVGFGKIKSSVLGEVLLNYHKLSEAIALNLFDVKGKLPKENKIRRKKGELENIRDLAETEFVYTKAASFSVFLKPMKQTIDLFDNSTSSEKINKSIFKLFEASNDTKSLESLKSNLDDAILSSYNNLLKEVKEKDITLAIQYANPETNFVLEDTFDSKKAIKILKNLDILEVGKPTELKAKGVFKALDSIAFSFKFESLNGEIYQGKFSEQLKMGIHFFNLKDLYQTSFDIFEIKDSGKTDVKEKIIMVSCVEIENK